MCWVCTFSDIDDTIEDQFFESNERFLEENIKKKPTIVLRTKSMASIMKNKIRLNVYPIFSRHMNI